MTPKSFLLSEQAHGYILDHTTPLDPVAADLVERTAELGGVSRMQIAPEQGAFLTILTKAIGVRSAVEVGTFTGYSALCIARGLAPGGNLLCCDVSEEWTSMGRQAWAEAGVADRIDLRIAPAIETLKALPDDDAIDLAFIDADKESYVDYYEELVPRLRPGGLLLADNVLWGGAVLDPRAEGDDLEAIRSFNDHVVADERVEVALLPIADGLTFAQKR